MFFLAPVVTTTAIILSSNKIQNFGTSLREMFWKMAIKQALYVIVKVVHHKDK